MERTNYPLILADDFKNHWLKEQTNEQYHADKSAVSSTGLLKVITETPLHFYQSHVMGENSPPTEAMKLGTKVHEAILEPEKFRAKMRVLPEFGDLRKKENKEKSEAWFKDLPSNAVVIEEEEAEMLLRIIENVKNHPLASKLLQGAIFETSGYYRDPNTGIKCRIRPDAYNIANNVLIDIKTTQDASPVGFSKSIANYYYDFQMAMYAEGIFQITGKRLGACCFIAVEKNPPYAIAVYQADNLILDTGMQLYMQALGKLHSCLEDDIWPSYSKKAKMISLPKWRLYEAEELIKEN